jgi:hypothetical protein
VTVSGDLTNAGEHASLVPTNAIGAHHRGDIVYTTPPVRTEPDIPPAKTSASTAIHRMVRSLVWDIGPSVAAYYGARALGFSDYIALLAGTVASAGRVIWVAVRDRRVDVFAMFLMVLFVVGLALTFATGDARFVLVKDSLTSLLAGLFFLGSCVIHAR